MVGPVPADPTKLDEMWTFTTPSPGRLYVYAEASLDAYNTGVDCDDDTVDFELFIDGVPVPGTTDLVGNFGFADIDAHGITAEPVAAGMHSLQAGAVCLDGTQTPRAVLRLSARGGDPGRS